MSDEPTLRERMDIQRAHTLRAIAANLRHEAERLDIMADHLDAAARK